jgi:hypothetical protein
LPFWAAKPEAKFHGGPLDRDYVWYFCDGTGISFLKAISIEEQHGDYCLREKAVNVFRINHPFWSAVPPEFSTVLSVKLDRSIALKVSNCREKKISGTQNGDPRFSAMD